MPLTRVLQVSERESNMEQFKSLTEVSFSGKELKNWMESPVTKGVMALIQELNEKCSNETMLGLGIRYRDDVSDDKVIINLMMIPKE